MPKLVRKTEILEGRGAAALGPVVSPRDQLPGTARLTRTQMRLAQLLSRNEKSHQTERSHRRKTEPKRKVAKTASKVWPEAKAWLAMGRTNMNTLGEAKRVFSKTVFPNKGVSGSRHPETCLPTWVLLERFPKGGFLKRALWRFRKEGFRKEGFGNMFGGVL